MNNKLSVLIRNRREEHITRDISAFCVEVGSDEEEIARELHEEGVLKLVRANFVKGSVNLNYKLYRIDKDSQ